MNDLKSQTENTTQKKITALNNASFLYDQLIDIYEKEYDQVFKSKDNDWRLKHDYKNLKDLDYQPQQLDQPDQAPPLWILSNDKFNKLKYHILSVKNNRSRTSSDGDQYDFSYMKRLIKDIANNKFTRDDVTNEVKDNRFYVDEIKRLKRN